MNRTEPPIVGKTNLEVFAETLMELAETDPDLLVVTSDSRGSGKLVPFAERFPGQLVEVGIAEQNLVGVAAGLASTGKRVFAVSPACFLATRALEQIKNDVAYSGFPVTLVGISAGVSYGALGSTHHSLHDVAALRAIPGVVIMVPADNFETRGAVRAAAASSLPCFLKLGKKPMPHLHAPGDPFEPGKASLILEGADVAIIACGETVAPAVGAARLLHSRNIAARVVSMHTLRPLDTETLTRAARECRAIITAEEHSLHGGLGEACASFLMENRLFVPFAKTGIPDQDTVTGSQSDIFTHYGLSPQGLLEKALALLNFTG